MLLMNHVRTAYQHFYKYYFIEVYEIAEKLEGIL